MTLMVLGVVLAASSGFEAQAAATAGVDLYATEVGERAGGFLHGRLSAEQTLGRAWVSAEASVLVMPTGASVVNDLGSRLTLGYRADGFVKAVSLEVSPFFLPMSRRASFDWLGNWVTNAYSPFGPTVAADVATTLGTGWAAIQLKKPQLAIDTPAMTPDLFFGVDVPLPESLRLELRGAWFTYGNAPALAGLGIKLPLFALGGAGRLSWTWNEEVGAMVDLVTYANDPTRFTRFATLERRRSPRAAQVFLEGGVVGQQLARAPSEGGVAQVGGWVDAQGRLRLGDARFFTTLRLQSVEHVVAPVPGYIPATAFPADAERAPALEARLGADLTLGSSKVTPGLLVSVFRPASITVAGQTSIPFGTTRLPRDFAVRAGVTTRASVRWDPAPFLALVAELSASADPNHYVVRDSIETLEPALVLLTWRAQLFAQARF